MARFLMVQGCSSSAGKSLTVAALCRSLRRRGIRVAPFKAQNMSNNSWVTADGREIGRAQAVQAAACGLEPDVDMNPILLKPEADAGSQVVVLGRAAFRTSAQHYHARKAELWQVVTAALDRLAACHEVVVIEGAGSPAEINLRAADIVNMRVALHARAPVLLVADIDRGGVFAHLYGTLALLAPEERALIAGAIINRFRGDLALLRPGLDEFTALTGLPVLGVVPYLSHHAIPEEDSLAGVAGSAGTGSVEVVVVRLPRLSNGTDFEPLLRDRRVRLRYAETAEAIGRPDLLVLPGTKSTVADLARLRERRIDRCVTALAASGVPVLGICGGYQMLGSLIRDPDHVEADADESPGLGLLDAVTTFESEKRTRRVRVRAAGLPFPVPDDLDAYEIHMGRTASRHRPAFLVDGRPDGAVGDGGLVWGTYCHGLFDNVALRDALVNWLRARRGLPPIAAAAEPDLDERLNTLADAFEESLDLEHILRLVGAVPARA